MATFDRNCLRPISGQQLADQLPAASTEPTVQLMASEGPNDRTDTFTRDDELRQQMLDWEATGGEGCVAVDSCQQFEHREEPVIVSPEEPSIGAEDRTVTTVVEVADDCDDNERTQQAMDVESAAVGPDGCDLSDDCELLVAVADS